MLLPPDPRRRPPPWVLVWWWLRRGVVLHLMATTGLLAGALVAPIVGVAAIPDALEVPADLLGWAVRVFPWVVGTWLLFGLLAVVCHWLTVGSEAALLIATASCGGLVALVAVRLLDRAWAPGTMPTVLVVLMVGAGFGTWSLFDRQRLAEVARAVA